jgi:virginiamycin B lyase
MRRLLVTLLAVGAIAPAFPQQARPAPVPKPGIPAVQHPMSMIVPDGQYDIDGGPDWMAMGQDMVWTNARGQNFVARMDPYTNDVVARVPMPTPCSGLVVAAGTLWAPSCKENVIYRIDTDTNKVVAKVPVGPANSEGGITFGAGAAWMPTDPKGIAVAKIDPATNKVIATIPVPPGSFTAVFNYGLVWVSSTESNVVSVISPASNQIIASIPVPGAPRFMAAGEGYVWTLNQKTGTVTKIDPRSKMVVATIDVGLPGTGGDIAAGEGAVWVTQHTVPLTRIDPNTNKVTAQFIGPGGDAMRVGHGYVWLSNGRWQNSWRFQTTKVDSFGHSWMSRAQSSDLDGDGKPDVLLEDKVTWFPGEATKFRMKLLDPAFAGKVTLKATLNGKTDEVEFAKSGEEWAATFTGKEPRWIHYSVCMTGSTKCTPELVSASPTTTLAYAMKKVRFVPEDFLLPVVPKIKNYAWNILEPEILDQDYQALMDRYEQKGPSSISKGEDYGELKRHRWEFQHQTSYAWGILTADKKQELACVYVNPSKKAGYDATVRLWVTKQGADAGLEPVLEAAVREWIKTQWPFKKVAYPGRDVSMESWNALPDSGE